MRFHKEGKGIIIISFIIFIAISICSWYFLQIYGLFIIIPLFILLGFILWFFRNPIRNISASPNQIIAPVDGKIVIIKEVYEKEFLHQNCMQISIFMSPLNVHVCRYPVGGKVTFAKYHPGKFLVAWHEKSSELNERTTTVVETNNKKVLFRQIAGMVARRIVYYAHENEEVKTGDELGFIKFGSRMDVFLPLGSKICIKLEQKVRGGEQIIAEFNEGI